LDAVDIAAIFDDGKDAAALRTIGEVARALGLRQHVLRYWEDQFPMLRPLTRAGGRRYYCHDDIALLITIDRLLHREGYTIRGARQTLAQPALRRPRATGDAAAPETAPATTTSPAISEPEAPEGAILGALGVLRRHLESIRERLADSLN
jgi:DNA-binding transcriptional MerR regulator